MIRRLVLAIEILALVASFSFATSSPVISANARMSMASGNAAVQQGLPLLFEFHNMTVGDSRQRFAYPQRNYNFRSEFLEAKSPLTLQYADFVGISANLYASAYYTKVNEYDDTVLPGLSGSFETSGFVDSVDFDFNGTIFAERHNVDDFAPFDRQETGWILWDDENTEFNNYGRWQGHLGMNYSFLRLELGRDAMHWGPGFYNNLTLNRNAVPYNYFAIDMTFGPLRVYSFYSKLEIDSAGVNVPDKGVRRLYGHRYEVALSNLTIGMSETQVIYNENNPWLLAPVVPLFIEKGNYTERSNNGAMAFDVNYRLFKMARIYSEFYLEDLESPISIIENEKLDSQWGLLAGFQVGKNLKLGSYAFEFGTIVEYARVDQRVYTHYEPNEAQVANAGFPLGNQGGPNSQTIDWTVYARFNGSLFVGLQNKWFWKGNVYGSDLNGYWIAGTNSGPKDFLGGAKMRYSLMPSFAYNGVNWLYSCQIGFIDDAFVQLNAGFKW